MTRGMKISLLHPTARLPEGWCAAFRAWNELADNPMDVEYILAIDKRHRNERMPIMHAICDESRFGNFMIAWNFLRECPVDAWNAAALNSTGQFLITASDDWFPPKHWDTLILAAVPDLDGDYVLDVDNQHPCYPLLPFSLLTRAYYQRLGYLFHPEYYGNMADCEFSDVARRDGVVIDAHHIQFEHRDPDRGAPWDPVYERTRRGLFREAGMEIYARRKQAGFPRSALFAGEVSAC